MRSGADARLPNDRQTGRSAHTFLPVYLEMFMQICREYRSLPDPKALTASEIRLFYEALRPELRERTKRKT